MREQNLYQVVDLQTVFENHRQYPSSNVDCDSSSFYEQLSYQSLLHILDHFSFHNSALKYPKKVQISQLDHHKNVSP